MILQDLHITPQRQAHIFATGALVIITLGTLATIAIVLAAFWLLVQAATLLLQSSIEALSTVGATYAAADPMVRFLLLLAIGFALYHLARRFIRRENQ